MEDNQIVGLITYKVSLKDIEIISLDSQIEGQGIGSALYQYVEELAEKHCKDLILYTTNDNLKALKFWQKKGFRMVHIVSGAADNARKIKKEIPDVGYEGIPLHDEILLKKIIT
ncbi:GNAT family N-acetyltransferase [Enterococcus sp. LJL120]